MTISAYGTSSPVDGSTRFCATRTPLLPESWWKRTVLRSTALYSFTGTVTIPKPIVPVHIARGIWE